MSGISTIAIKFLRLCGSENEHESRAALEMLKRYAEKNGWTWNQFVDLLLSQKSFPLEHMRHWEDAFNSLRDALKADFMRMQNETPEQANKRQEMARKAAERRIFSGH